MALSGINPSTPWAQGPQPIQDQSQGLPQGFLQRMQAQGPLNPLTLMGLGILSNQPQRGQGALGGIAGGLLGGLQMHQQMKQQQQAALAAQSERRRKGEETDIKRGNLTVAQDNLKLAQQKQAFNEAKPDDVETRREILDSLIDSGKAANLGEAELLLRQSGRSVTNTNVNLPGANRMDEIRGGIGDLNRGVDNVDRLIQIATENPGSFGASGTARKIGQETAGIAGDVLSNVPFLDNIAQAISEGLAERGIGDMFDETIPESDRIVNGVAYGLARARKPTGRLAVQDVKNARDDVKIRGIRSTEGVIEGLKQIRKELDDARKDLFSRSEGNIPQGVPRFRIENGTLVPIE